MSRDRSEAGFTLVEVLMVTIISGIVIGGIATALIVTFNTYPQSASRLSSSDNAHLLSSWLVGDVQSAGWSDAANGPNIDTNPNTNIDGCGGTNLSPTNVVKLAWTDFDTGHQFSADYRQVGSELIRYFCQDGSNPTSTTVGRDIGSAVATPTNGPPGCAPRVGHCQDSVNVHVRSNPLANGSTYTFDVSASRRTPALRIYAVPTINLGQVNSDSLPVSGTAEPKANVRLTITDTTQPTSKVITVNNIGTLSNGTWDASTKSIELDNLKDGPITFQVQSTDGAGHTSTATTTAIKDATPPTTSLTAVSGSPTSDTTLQYMATFSTPVSDLNPGGVSVVPPSGDQVGTPAIGKIDSQHFTISVTMQAGDNVEGPVSVRVKAGAVTDAVGNGNVASTAIPIAWSNTLTITASPGNGSASFSGIAGHGPNDNLIVTVSVCTDRSCSSPPTTTVPNIAVDPTTGSWSVPNTNLGSNTYYAEVSQTDKAGNTKPVFTGPFTT